MLNRSVLESSELNNKKAETSPLLVSLLEANSFLHPPNLILPGWDELFDAPSPFITPGTRFFQLLPWSLLFIVAVWMCQFVSEASDPE